MAKRDSHGRKGGYRALTQKFSEREKEASVLAQQAPEMANLPMKTVHGRLFHPKRFGKVK